MNKYLIISFLFITSFLYQSYSNEILVLTDILALQGKEYNLTKRVSFLNSNFDSSIDSVIRYGQVIPNDKVGKGRKNGWYCIQLIDSTTENVNWILKLNVGYQYDAWIVSNSTEIKYLGHFARAARTNDSINIFNYNYLKLGQDIKNKDTVKIYIKMKNYLMSRFTVSIGTINQYLVTTNNFQVISLIALGVFFFVIIFNLLNYIALKNKSYLYLLLFSIGCLLQISEIFHPLIPYPILQSFIIITANFNLYFGFIYVYDFIPDKPENRKYKTAIIILYIIAVLIVLFQLANVLSDGALLDLEEILLSFSRVLPLGPMFILLIVWRKGYKPAFLMFMVWIVPVFIILVSSLIFLNLVDRSSLPSFLYYLTTSHNLLTLSFALMLIFWTIFQAYQHRSERESHLIDQQKRDLAEKEKELQLQKNKELESLNKDLADEKERADKLLLNILPRSIADRLKENEYPIYDYFDSVSIVFIDLIGFTALSGKITGNDLVKFLNDVFTAFDKISAKYGLEKIKTIGDCYMASAGIPVPMKHHSIAAANFAVEAISIFNDKNHSSHFSRGDKHVIDTFLKEQNKNLNLRCGINCGPVIAGVIGESKFTYDLWGNTVNIASRMESSSEAGKIQITEHFRNALEADLAQNGIPNDFKIEKRGEINIRGKGKMNTFYLNK